MKDDPDPVKHDQVPRAANLIYAAVAFYRTLRDEQLQPGVMVYSSIHIYLLLIY